MLLPFLQDHLLEAGCDEAGRGCLAGPVYAAAVILPQTFYHPLLTDSKQLSPQERFDIRLYILENAIAWAVGSCGQDEIDEINILNASFLAMHRALKKLAVAPEFIIVDGNRFHAYKNIDYRCIVKGDALYFSIAAASVLAKTYRDEYMNELHQEHPVYNWQNNKGYPTPCHRRAIMKQGLTPYHRKTFGLCATLMNA